MAIIKHEIIKPTLILIICDNWGKGIFELYFPSFHLSSKWLSVFKEIFFDINTFATLWSKGWVIYDNVKNHRCAANPLTLCVLMFIKECYIICRVIIIQKTCLNSKGVKHRMIYVWEKGSLSRTGQSLSAMW